MKYPRSHRKSTAEQPSYFGWNRDLHPQQLLEAATLLSPGTQSLHQRVTQWHLPNSRVTVLSQLWFNKAFFKKEQLLSYLVWVHLYLCVQVLHKKKNRHIHRTRSFFPRIYLFMWQICLSRSIKIVIFALTEVPKNTLDPFQALK